MPQVLVIESGEPVLREFKITPTTRERRIFLKHQQVLIKLQEKARKEVPFADGWTRKMVFNI